MPLERALEVEDRYISNDDPAEVVTDVSLFWIGMMRGEVEGTAALVQ